MWFTISLLAAIFALLIGAGELQRWLLRRAERNEAIFRRLHHYK